MNGQAAQAKIANDQKGTSEVGRAEAQRSDEPISPHPTY